MIRCEDLYNIFHENNLTFFSGVPDSLFKEWMKFLDDNEELTNIISSNECEAVANCLGYYLATGKLGIVYMQNSGFGKTINPLTSLADPEVYSVPMLLMVGWRGKPGVNDEPQHKKMGKIMTSMMDVMDIPYRKLPQNIEQANNIINELINIAKTRNGPVALIIEKNTLEEYVSKTREKENNYEMLREDALKIIINSLNKEDIVVSTTGKTSRELFEYRVFRGEQPYDFYTVGGMGCASAIGNSIALNSNKKVYVLDGDGASIMQLGSFATIGHYNARNLYHILFDNNAHESTGAQPTVSDTVNFEKIALASSYRYASTIKTKQELIDWLELFKTKQGPYLLVVKVKPGSRKDLGRPTSSPIDNKESFMKKFK